MDWTQALLLQSAGLGLTRCLGDGKRLERSPGRDSEDPLWLPELRETVDGVSQGDDLSCENFSSTTCLAVPSR